MLNTSPIIKPGFITIFLSIWLIITSVYYYLQPLHPYTSIAHRGASFYAPENTISAFQKAFELGFDYIELDIRLSKDGQIVVIHDENVLRTTNGEGLIEDLTAEELKKLDAGSWFSSDFRNERIPLLDEVLTHFGGRIGILIDVKTSENQSSMSESLSDLLSYHIKKGINPDKIKIQSFSIPEIKKMNELLPDIGTGLLLNKPLDLLQLAAYRPYASFLSIHHQLLSKSFINKAHLLGFNIFTWTIKKQYQFPIMQRLGVHGIISDEEFKGSSVKFASLISPIIKD